MYLRVSNWAAATAVSLALATLAGCSGAEPGAAPPPPPPPPERSYAPPPADLAGAPPPAPDSSGLAGGTPEPPSAPAVVTMAPIPNPEDLPPAERRRIYGTAYDGEGGVDHGPAAHPAERAAPTRPVVAPRPRPIKPAPARPAAVAGPPAAEKPAVTTPTAPEVAPRGIFNWGTVDVPGVGRMRWETVVGSGLLLLALVLLVAIARNASEAEARARRRRQKPSDNVEAGAAPPGETKTP